MQSFLRVPREMLHSEHRCDATIGVKVLQINALKYVFQAFENRLTPGKV